MVWFRQCHLWSIAACQIATYLVTKMTLMAENGLIATYLNIDLTMRIRRDGPADSRYFWEENIRILCT